MSVGAQSTVNGIVSELEESEGRLPNRLSGERGDSGVDGVGGSGQSKYSCASTTVPVASIRNTSHSLSTQDASGPT